MNFKTLTFNQMYEVLLIWSKRLELIRKKIVIFVLELDRAFRLWTILYNRICNCMNYENQGFKTS